MADAVATEPTPMSETPEFQMELAKATTEIHDKVMAEVKAMMAGVASVGQGSDIKELARAIALSNAEIADQGTNRKRVAPEILESQHQSFLKMHALLEKAQSLPASKQPRYAVAAKVYVGDRLIEPYQRLSGGRVEQTRILFLSAPNLGLKPINEAAKEIYDAFVGSLSARETSITGWGGSKFSTPNEVNAPPVWMTKNGAVISSPTATALEHDQVMTPEIGDGDNGPQAEEQMAMDDPRRRTINVLGNIAPPAQRGQIQAKVL